MGVFFDPAPLAPRAHLNPKPHQHRHTTTTGPIYVEVVGWGRPCAGRGAAVARWVGWDGVKFECRFRPFSAVCPTPDLGGVPPLGLGTGDGGGGHPRPPNMEVAHRSPRPGGQGQVGRAPFKVSGETCDMYVSTIGFRRARGEEGEGPSRG